MGHELQEGESLTSIALRLLSCFLILVVVVAAGAIARS